MWMFAPLAAFAAQVDTMSVDVGRPSTGIVEGTGTVAALSTNAPYFMRRPLA